MEPPDVSTSEESALTGRKTLGEVSVNRDAFELDLKINEGYQSYSAELMRLALLILTGISAVWLKIFLVPGPVKLTQRHSISLILSFLATALAAGTALLHRYTAADSLAYHLTALRLRARNRPARPPRRFDAERSAKNFKKHVWWHRWIRWLLRRSRNSSALSSSLSDADLSEKEFKERDLRFLWARWLLRSSIAFLFLGLLLFCYSLLGLMFP